jgi:hypothetical protein
MAPPWYQTSIVEWCDGAAAACPASRPIASSLSSGTLVDFQ